MSQEFPTASLGVDSYLKWIHTHTHTQNLKHETHTDISYAGGGGGGGREEKKEEKSLGS